MARLKYIVNEKGEKTAVIIPIKAFEKMLDKLEDYEDIKLLDKLRNRKTPVKYYPFEEVKERLKRKGKLD